MVENENALFRQINRKKYILEGLMNKASLAGMPPSHMVFFQDSHLEA